jgi:hypothetical protein
VRPSFGAGAGTGKFWVEVQHNFEPKKTDHGGHVRRSVERWRVGHGRGIELRWHRVHERERKIPAEKHPRAVERGSSQDQRGEVRGLRIDLRPPARRRLEVHERNGIDPDARGATSAVDFELCVNNAVKEGGSNVIKKHDYTALPDPIADKAEEGLKEVIF